MPGGQEPAPAPLAPARWPPTPRRLREWDTLGSDFNFQIDRPHDGKPKHVDLTVRIPGLGADKVEVDFNGNVLGGSTQIGSTKIKW